MDTKYNLLIKTSLRSDEYFIISSHVGVNRGKIVIYTRDEDMEYEEYKGVVIDWYESDQERDWKFAEIDNSNRFVLNGVIGNLVNDGVITISEDIREKCRKDALRKGKSEISFEQFKRRIARDIILADRPKEVIYDYVIRFDYGFLYIYIDLMNNVVYDVKNGANSPKGWKRNDKLFEKLNEVFEIFE